MKQTASQWQPMGGVKGEICRRVGPVNPLITPVRSSSSVFVLK